MGYKVMKMRIGIPGDYLGEGLDPEVKEAVLKEKANIDLCSLLMKTKRLVLEAKIFSKKSIY